MVGFIEFFNILPTDASQLKLAHTQNGYEPKRLWQIVSPESMQKTINWLSKKPDKTEETRDACQGTEALGLLQKSVEVGNKYKLWTYIYPLGEDK